MRPTITAIERDLRGILQGDVEFDDLTRHLYATDGGIYQIEPLGVVSPRDTEDVRRLVTYATERDIPLVPRGSGSGLAGAAVGAGIQVDFTRYMNKILEVAADGSWARVQPGVVMGVLNQRVKPLGTFFAPNPSSENYCSLGGMLANNSSGGRSVAYGGAKDHTLAVEVVLHGGEVFRAGTVRADGPELAALLASDSVAGRAYGRMLRLLRDKAAVIAASMPRVMKNCSGYRIEGVLGGDDVHLHQIFVGAEGTLGLMTEATLNLVPLPGRRAIAMAYFPTVFAAGEAVFPLLDLKPTSLEIMDANFLSFVRKHNAKLDTMLPAGADTALLIEFEAGDDAELDERLTSVESLLGGGAALQVKRALDADEQKHLWAVRQAAVPLLQKLPGPKRIAEFIEDCTVHPEVLATYMHTLSGILKKYDVQAIMYGHAGDGNIHTRPILNLKSAVDLSLMQTILDEVIELVLGLKGTPSGEHGDGIVRSPYVRQVYGDEVYGVFREIKDAFDPTGIINPGKKVVSKAEGGGVARNLRYGPTYYTHEQSPFLHFPAGEYEREIEKCHGCAQCRSLVGTTMCPTYKATRREHASPRAKANLLRNIISGRLDPTASYVADATKEITDYCIECGMCVHECPSNVNIPKLMLEAKARYRSAERVPGATDLLLGHATRLSQGGRLVSPLANRLVNLGPLRNVGERLVGIDRRRTMPRFARHTFAQLVAEQAKGTTLPQVAPWPAPDGAEWAGMPAPKVAFFYDLYVNYHDPGLGQTMENLLRAHGVDVRYPAQKASGIPEMLYGYWEAARDTARYNLDHALPYVHDGALLVSGEPTASFAFKAHYTDYVASADASLVANATRDLGEFLATLQADRPGLAPEPTPIKIRAAYHQPCHLKGQQVGAPFFDLMRTIPGMELVNLDAGCCGMAGTFGMKSHTYDLSMQTGQPLFDRVAAVKPDLLVSECSTCRMQLEQATGVPTAHPAEIMARAWGL